MGVIQGLDTIPKEIANLLKDEFVMYLPGWSATGAHNFKPGANNAKAALQLGITMQNGSHPWINEASKDLFKHPTWLNADGPRRTELLAAFENFMNVAHSPESLAADGKYTGNFVSYSSRSDPKWIAEVGPGGLDENGLVKKEIAYAHAKRGIDWNNITNSDAGKDAIATKPKVVEVGGSGDRRNNPQMMSASGADDKLNLYVPNLVDKCYTESNYNQGTAEGATA